MKPTGGTVGYSSALNTFMMHVKHFPTSAKHKISISTENTKHNAYTKRLNMTQKIIQINLIYSITN